MKNLFTFLITLFISTGLIRAQNADPAVNILFQPASVSVGASGTATVSVQNAGATAINAGCAIITVSVPSIAKIKGLVATPGFSSTINSSGTSIQISNSGTALTGISTTSLSVIVQGISIGGPSTIASNITYDPLQGAACSSAGNLNTQNDNSQTTIQVVANPLPVSLLTFTAEAQTNKTVKLNWATSSETGNDYFLLERSKDLVQIESVAKVAAAEGASIGHTYTYVDEHPYNGTSYYRLRQFDLDGRSTAFDWKPVITDNQVYGVYPNPIRDNQFVLNLDEPENASLRMFSVEGRQISLQKMETGVGSVKLKTAQKLTTGVYVLRVEERAQVRKYRLVVE